MNLKRTLPLFRSVTAALAATLSLGVASSVLAQTDPNILVVAVPGDIQNLDPTLSGGDLITQEMLTNTFDWLIDYKTTASADGTVTSDPSNFVGALAESYEWSDDKKTVTFRLREGLKFANGDPLDAEAVKFTYDRLFDQDSVTAVTLKQASVSDKDHIKVIDPLTVQLSVDVANPLLFGYVAQYGNAILNPKVVKPHMTAEDPAAHEWLKTNIQGTEQGPFKLAQWTPGDSWVLDRNDNYWGEKPKLQRIIFKIIPDASSRLAQLISGSVDIAYDLPANDLKSLKDNPDITLHVDTSRTAGYFGMNNEVPPFDNKLVRQAVSYAFPYDEMINQVWNGFATPLTSPIPEGMLTHTDEFFHYKNDPEKAKELLTQAGYPDGFSTTLQIPAGIQQAKDAAVYTQQSLAQAGINVTIQEMPGAAYTEQLQKHTLGFFWNYGWTSINNDPLAHLYWLFKSKCCNFTNYKNDDLNAALDKYMLSTDIDARNAASVAAQKQIVDDAPWIFRDSPQRILATRASVKGYVYYSSDNYVRFKHLYKE